MPPRPSPHDPALAPRMYAIPVCNPCQGKVCQLQTEVSWAGGVGVMVIAPSPQLPALEGTPASRLSPSGDAAAECSSSQNPVAMRSSLRHFCLSLSPAIGREKGEQAKR